MGDGCSGFDDGDELTSSMTGVEHNIMKSLLRHKIGCLCGKSGKQPPSLCSRFSAGASRTQGVCRSDRRPGSVSALFL